MIYVLSSILGSNLPASQIIAYMLGYILALIIAFSMHEFSHAFSAYKLGDPTPKAMGRLTLNPVKHIDIVGMLGFLIVGFGWAKPVPINPLNFRKYRRDNFIVSISGVLTNLILAFIFSGILHFFYNGLANTDPSGAVYTNSLLYFIHYFLEYSVILNLALFIFNLIPVYPLDGFNAIKSFAKYNNRFVNFMYKYGNIIMLVIILTPVFDIIYQGTTGYLLGVFDNFWGLFG